MPLFLADVLLRGRERTVHVSRPWVGFDFDGTLASSVEFDPATGLLPLGRPVPEMVALVRDYLHRGVAVRVVTARVAASGAVNRHGVADTWAFAETQARILQGWCERHIGQRLDVTCSKDLAMIRLYDDRAVCVERDTGRLLSPAP